MAFGRSVCTIISAPCRATHLFKKRDTNLYLRAQPGYLGNPRFSHTFLHVELPFPDPLPILVGPQFSTSFKNCGPTRISPSARKVFVKTFLRSDLLDSTRSAERVPLARLRILAGTRKYSQSHACVLLDICGPTRIRTLIKRFGVAYSTIEL